MQRAEYAEAEHSGMNTVMTHRAYGRRAAEALRAVRWEAGRLEARLSRFRPGSDISRVNRAAGRRCERVSGETFAVLDRAVSVSMRSEGLFDVTIAPLVALWGEGKAERRAPEDASIRRALALVGCAGLTLDAGRGAAGLRYPGQAVDLGGIGKGYAADRFLDVFRKYGVSSAFTNIGGNVAALGTKPDGSPWRVGIRHPRQEGGLIGSVTIADRSVVTSGDYQRYFMDGEGVRRHHILDPVTGYPAYSGLMSVTVIAASSMEADTLSTALFVAGMVKGVRLLKHFDGAEAVFVGTDLRVHASAGLRGQFQPAEGIDADFLN